jgi:hypothetical protein
MATTQSLATLQEVVQKLSDNGMMKEEAFRQISEATVSIYNASLQDNPFKNEAVAREDCVDMEIGGIPGDFVRHIPTGRIFTRAEDGKLEFMGIIMGDNFLPLTGEGVHIPARHQSAVCWLHGEDPKMKEVSELVKQIEIREKETQRQLKELAEQSKKMKEQLRAAREGSLLAFQEVEIEDLEEERDRFKKLNGGLLKKLKEQKEENERDKRRWAQCQNDLSKDLVYAWERMRENEIPIPTTTEETAKFCRWWSDNQDTLPECFRPVPFVWNGVEYLLVEPTNQILDKEDGEVLGERFMCGECDEVHVKWYGDDTSSGEEEDMDRDSDSE